MRNFGIDLLRFVAVLLVIGRHVDLGAAPNAFMSHWHTGGWIGVDLFFVLSGFLVSGLLFKEHLAMGNVRIGWFLVRRGLKIYPPFYFLLLVTLAFVAIGDGSLPARKVLGEVVFLQNYIGALWGHTWSLAVEEHFYIGLALLFAWLVSRRVPHPFSAVPIIFVILALACLGLRFMAAQRVTQYANETHLFPTHLRVDSLFYGVLLSYLHHYKGLDDRIRRIPSTLLVIAGIAMLAPAFFFPIEKNMWMATYGVILLYIGSGFLLLAAVRYQAPPLKPFVILSALGATSYSIYLWHLPIQYWSIDLSRWAFGEEGYRFYFWTYMIGSFVFGYAISKGIEFPVLRFRDRFIPSRSGGALEVDQKPIATADETPPR